MENTHPHTDLPIVAADNAAEAAKQRQLNLTQKRVETLERLKIAQRPAPTPVAASSSKKPLDDFTRTDVNDRKKILLVKVTATLKRLAAIKEIEEYQLRLDVNCDKVKKFDLGFRRLESLVANIDRIAPKLTQKEWTQVNWGLTAIGGVSFKGLRRNYDHVLGLLSEYCVNYFSCLDIESLL